MQPSGELEGRTINNFELVELVGQGGMAHVYRALEHPLERNVALKLMAQSAGQASPNETGPDSSFARRFLQEARAIAALQHPNILTIYHYGEWEGRPYIVTELMEGGSLLDLLKKEGQLALPEAVEIISQVGRGLEQAHAHNIIHRDLKPSNVLLDHHGRVVLADFGIAKVVNSLDGGANTMAGTALGTPEYMSPEQSLGEGVDRRSDIYSLGVLTYRLLCGRLPFERESPLATLIAHARENPVALRGYNPGLPEGVEAVVMRSLEKDPNRRYQTAAEFVNALRGAAGIGESITAQQMPVLHPVSPTDLTPDPVPEKLNHPAGVDGSRPEVTPGPGQNAFLPRPEGNPVEVEGRAEGANREQTPFRPHVKSEDTPVRFEGQVVSPTVPVIPVSGGRVEENQPRFTYPRVSQVQPPDPPFRTPPVEEPYYAREDSPVLPAANWRMVAPVPPPARGWRGRPPGMVPPPRKRGRFVVVGLLLLAALLIGASLLLLRDRNGAAVIKGAENNAGAVTNGGRLLFSMVENNKWDVYSAAPDGSGFKKLTSGGVDNLSPALSPDGKTLAYIAAGANNRWQLRKVNSDGGGDAALTPGDARDQYPAWSPDGKQLVFSSNRENSGFERLYSVGQDGKNLKRLNEENSSYSSWSPSNQIIYTALLGGAHNLRRLDPAAGKQVNLTISEQGEFDFAVWSVDGKRIAAVRGLNADRSIYLMNGDGTNQTRLTPVGETATNPAWSPDGLKITYLTRVGTDGSGRDRWELAQINADGSGRRQLTNDGKQKFYLTWSLS